MTKKDDFRIVFMGTPEFGGIVLEEIIKNGYNVIGGVFFLNQINLKVEEERLNLLMLNQ